MSEPRTVPDGFVVVHPMVCGIRTQADADALYAAYIAFERHPERGAAAANEITFPNRWDECLPPPGYSSRERMAWNRGFRTAMAMGLRTLGDYWSRMLGPVDDAVDMLHAGDDHDLAEQLDHQHMSVFDAIEGHAKDAPGLSHVPSQVWDLMTNKFADIVEGRP